MNKTFLEKFAVAIGLKIQCQVQPVKLLHKYSCSTKEPRLPFISFPDQHLQVESLASPRHGQHLGKRKWSLPVPPPLLARELPPGKALPKPGEQRRWECRTPGAGNLQKTWKGRGCRRKVESPGWKNKRRPRCQCTRKERRG